jgi:uncharacterized damage-inducible protein DinB
MTTEQAFIDWALRKMEQQEARICACLDRLNDTQIWLRGGENENAPGNLILHLCGNIRQWIGSGVAGLPDSRDRDSEFSARDGSSKSELLAGLSVAIAEACTILKELPPTRLPEKFHSVQGYDVTVLEAIGHVVEHLGYHTGQIVFLTKALTHEDLAFYGHLRGTGRHKEATP